MPNYPYAYVPRSEIEQYWTLAKRYVLADRMFQSNTGPSFGLKPKHVSYEIHEENSGQSWNYTLSGWDRLTNKSEVEVC